MKFLTVGKLSFQRQRGAYHMRQAVYIECRRNKTQRLTQIKPKYNKLETMQFSLYGMFTVKQQERVCVAVLSNGTDLKVVLVLDLVLESQSLF